MKRKTEEMKAKIYSLRTQKMELDRRVVEMQSTIGSIKDEQKIMESVLEEKQSEIKMLGEMNKDAEKETLQMVALRESLKQKEVEIEDLKHRLHECPQKIRSVSTDDPSSPPLNLTVTSSTVNKDKVEVGKSNEEVVQLHESVYGSNGLNSTRDNGGNTTSTNTEEGADAARFENASESRVGITDRKEVFGEEQSQTLEGSRNGSTVGIDNDQGYRIESSQEKGASGAGEENNDSNATETIVTRAGRLSKTADEDIDEKSMDSEEEVTHDRQLGLENVQAAEDRQGTFRGGAKLEMADRSRSKGKEKYQHASTVRGKRGTTVATNRLLENSHENNGVEKLRNRKFSSDNQGIILINREEGSGSNVDSSDATSMEHQNPEDSKDLENELGKDRTNHQTSEVHGTSKRLRIAHDSKVLTNGRLDGQLSNIRSNDRKQSLDEGQQHEDQQEDRSTQESRNSSNMSNKGNSDEQAKLITKNEREEEMEDSNTEHETDAGAGDFYKDSVSDLEEDKEEYREETDESEF
ncbi:unnamed protein product [Dovyalis caffra]|uniref:Uncharacterized protein n=1 Tax=Dovyalis caffra TaxID=77055 RepID=A0AAV1SHL6_9ROSI|nr:unnamed protein product [Dovyalis caffra]